MFESGSSETLIVFNCDPIASGFILLGKPCSIVPLLTFVTSMVILKCFFEIYFTGIARFLL